MTVITPASGSSGSPVFNDQWEVLASSYGADRTLQVPVRRIAGLTGLDLAPYIAEDPLERFETTGLPRELVKLEHILL